MVVVDIIITYKINKHLETLGRKESFPFTTIRIITYIADCVKIQKETSDKKLKNLLLLVITCHAASIILFILWVFYIMIWPCL